MPEGPEIRLAADEVAAAIVGRRADDVWFANSRLKRFQRQLAGSVVTEVTTRGKAILTEFDNELVIYSHNQLYGRWLVALAGELPQTGRQLRLAIHNSDYSALLYSASDIAVLHSDRLQMHPFLSRLGPDVLSENPSITQLADRLGSPNYCNRQLAGLLLDQGFVAGLGNYLRAEILLVAGLHPRRKPADCSRSELRKLAATIIKLTRRSYRTRGIVTTPTLVKKLKAAGLTAREQHRFAVYGREAEDCYYCGAKIERINAGGRHIYFCPRCQPEGWPS